MGDQLIATAEGGRIILKFRAPLRLDQVPEVLADFQRLLAQSPTAKCSFDLADVTLRDHQSVAALAELSRASRAAGRPLSWTPADHEVATFLQQDRGAPVAAGYTVLSLPSQVGRRTVELTRDLLAMLGFVGEVAYALALAARHPRRVRWRDTWYYLDRCGSDAVPIVGLICFLMGLILGFQAAVQMHAFGADMYVADLVGLSITKELGPLMVAMICTGRAGSAFAAEIGTMKVSEEVDALVTMGLDPYRFLIVPKVLALAIAMPLLTIYGSVAGVAGGLAVGMAQLGIPFIAYFHRTISVITPLHLAEGLTKSLVFAVLIAGVGCLRGLRTRGGALGVGTSTTSAVVTGIFLVILADTALTVLFSRLGVALQ